MDVSPEQEEQLFHAARCIASKEERDIYLGRACGEDWALRQRIDALLKAFDEGEGMTGRVLAFGATAVDESAAISERPGSTIGPYQLLEQIGEGGFGIVFMAEQLQPVRRKVALKVLKPGMDTRQVIARFEAERQALAMMDHPNIARVFDAGTTESGRPYFVMELVSGTPVTGFCNDNTLTIRRRLDVFVQVCAAVQHAHQKGIIHRDIKPSNVLVTTLDDKPIPKVIDFGIAKATQGRLTDRTLLTDYQQLMGTPAYMSPEQAQMSAPDVDTRSDIYSLGVLLYELLTGTTPFDAKQLRSTGQLEMLRIIREVEPSKPSTRLSTLDAAILTATAGQRRSDAKVLGRSIRRDLDWIVMKCLEKDRDRRYETVTSLNRDIQRYLNDELVEASPPSTAYRLRKAFHKHRRPLIIAFVLVLVLLVGTGVSTWQAVRARRAQTSAIGAQLQASRDRDQALAEKRRADEQASIASAVSKFLTEMLGAADPDRLMGDKVTVLQAIHEALKHLDEDLALKDKPLVEAAVRRVIGVTLGDLSRYDEAEPQLLNALAIRRSHLPSDDPAVAESLTDLAYFYMDRSRFDGFAAGAVAAEPLLREALRIRTVALAPSDPLIASTMSSLAMSLTYQGKLEEAEPLARESVARLRKSPKGAEFLVAAINDLAILLSRNNKLEEAESLLREALDQARAHNPAGHPMIGISLINLASLLEMEKKLDQAEPFCREAVEIFRKALPDGDFGRIKSLNELVIVLEGQKKLRQSWSNIVEPAHELFDQVGHARPAPRDTGVLLSHYGLALYYSRQYSEAYQPLLDAFGPLDEVSRATPQTWLVPEDDQRIQVVDALMRTCEQIGRPDEADQWQARAFEIKKNLTTLNGPVPSTKAATSLPAPTPKQPVH